MRVVLLFFCFTVSCVSCAKRGSDNLSILKPPSSYFPNKTKVLVVGTFHFDYPDLDFIKSEDDQRIDVLADPKKSEVIELVEYIKLFRPNKIAIEAFNNWNVTPKLRAYRSGSHRNERDERFQIAIRLADELNLDILYAIDAKSMRKEFTSKNPDYANEIYEAYDFRTDDPYFSMIMEWRNNEDSAIPKVNLLDYFKFMNSRTLHEYTYGVYLTGDFRLKSGRGEDALSIGWYIRIFRKLQEITDDENDRILVLFGNGHGAILRHLLESLLSTNLWNFRVYN